MADEYRRFGFASSAALEREILLATAFEAGAAGAEETEQDGRFRACVYATSDRIERIRTLLSAAAANTTEVESVEALPDVDWRQAWKEGLEALRISPRLLIRPSFIVAALEPGQREILIDPGQAFGTGGHASTRLCLEWIDDLMHRAQPGDVIDRVLDVGTGSGILALAAVALGGGRALGFDLDPVAVRAAREAAACNGLDSRVQFFAGPIEALASTTEKYPLVVANLLKSEMLPIASPLASQLAPSGRLVLAGLLEEDVAPVCARFAHDGLHEVGRRSLEDSTGRWVGLCLAFD